MRTKIYSNRKEFQEQRRDAHRCRIERELTRIVALLKKRSDITTVMMVGSMARGTIHLHSDLDLVIIQQTDKRFMDRLADIYSYVLPEIEVDIFVYTSNEWEALPNRQPFIKRLKQDAKVLYERTT